MASHQDVAHNWAHETGRARNGKNMFHCSGIVYSYGYHFPIAIHRKDARGKPYILFTTRGYSSTTSDHIWIVRAAIPNKFTVYNVDNVKADSKPEHRANYEIMRGERQGQFEKAGRARKYASTYLACADKIRESMNAYTKAFKLGFRAIPSDLVPAEAKAAVERAKALMAAQEKRDKIKIRKWLKFETNSAPKTRTPYVRVQKDSGEVQTSHGIRVPKDKAIALFKLATKCKARSRSYKPVKTQRIGHFMIDGISDKGTLKVGCHIIPLSVQRLAAKMIGLYP